MESELREEEAINFGKSLIVPSVQELAKQSIVNIPPRYIRKDEDPPIVTNDACLPSVPVIDLQKLVSVDYELERLHLACKEWGFFQVFTVNLVIYLRKKW